MQFTAVQTIYIVTTVRLFIEVTEFKWSVSDIIKHLGISDSLMGSLNGNKWLNFGQKIFKNGFLE